MSKTLQLCLALVMLLSATMQFNEVDASEQDPLESGTRVAAKSVLDQTIIPSTPSESMSVEKREYGVTSQGENVTMFVCQNSQGNTMSMIDYGATMVSLEFPDREGKRDNIILTCPDMAGWEKCQTYFGCVAGRFCNRIAKGKFSINGTMYQLAVNNGENHLHGGIRGFDKVMWVGEPLVTNDAVGVRFKLQSPDGDEGYPGNINVVAEFLLTNTNELHIEFRAKSDKLTPVNLTNHNYWNLGGHNSGNHFGHELMVEADKYLESDATLIPTGNLLDVVGSPLDFLTFRKMGERIELIGDDAIKGYDHCYAVRNFDGTMRPVATVRDPKSGRVMEILSTQPGLQFYTGNFLDGSEGGAAYPQYSGFCLETQHFPDSPNHSDFPSTLLEPGDDFVEKTIHKFSIQ